ALHVQVDLLLAEDEGAALDGRRAAHKGLEPHAQCIDVEADAGLLVGGGQYEVVEMVDHRASPALGSGPDHIAAWPRELRRPDVRRVPRSLRPTRCCRPCP